MKTCLCRVVDRMPGILCTLHNDASVNKFSLTLMLEIILDLYDQFNIKIKILNYYYKNEHIYCVLAHFFLFFFKQLLSIMFFFIMHNFKWSY